MEPDGIVHLRGKLWWGLRRMPTVCLLVSQRSSNPAHPIRPINIDKLFKRGSLASSFSCHIHHLLQIYKQTNPKKPKRLKLKATYNKQMIIFMFYSLTVKTISVAVKDAPLIMKKIKSSQHKKREIINSYGNWQLPSCNNMLLLHIYASLKILSGWWLSSHCHRDYYKRVHTEHRWQNI